MKFHYTILINGTNMAVQKDIEADNIAKATISAKARVKEIWGLTAKLKQKIINREKDFYKDEYYSQNKETGRYKKEFTLIVKALNKTQDSGSRVFDRLFKVLDNAKQYKISCLGTPPSVKRTDLVQKRPKIGDDIKISDSEKPFRVVATYRTSGKKRHFLVLANSFNEAKNKVKRHYEKSGLMDILSDIEKFEGYEIKSIPTEKFKKHYGNKEVIVN